jgi:hypothetical protein
MSEERVEERSREIGEAAEGYVLHAWQVRRSRVVHWLWVLVFAGLTLVLAWDEAWWDQLEQPWRGLAHGALRALWYGLLAAGLAWYVWFVFRGGWREWYFGSDHQLGLVLPPSSQRFRWPYWLSSLSIAILIGSSGLTGLMLPLRFQPLWYALLLAASWAANAFLGPDRLRRLAWSSVRIGCRLLYLAYALAVAVGMPQPWSEGRSLLSLGVPLASVLALQVILDALYSRRQFRRLQRLVNEETDGMG